MAEPPRLHVNVDHVATLRQARRIDEPDPVTWALLAEKAGAQGITCHLRKDRRHIQDADVRALRERITTLLNLESSLDPEMIAIALESRAEAICLVPENRKEITTEGGLDVLSARARLSDAVPAFAERNALVTEEDWFDSTFITNGARMLMAPWTAHRVAFDYAMGSDWDDQWRTGGSVEEIVREAHLDPEHLLEGLGRFADEREERLQRAAGPAALHSA